MYLIRDILESMYLWMNPICFEVATAQIATILVIYGNDLNEWVKRGVTHFHFLVRFPVYVFVCAFGYGMLTVFSAELLAEVLEQLNKYTLPVVVLTSFSVIGILAQRKSQI